MRAVTVVASALVISWSLAACGGPAAPAAPAAGTASSTPAATSTAPAAAGSSSGTLTIALISTGDSKIPAFTTTQEDAEINDQIYDSLLQVNPDTMQIQPDLATSYSVSPDGKTWTFHLRHGVTWQRGFGAFTCADVAFTWEFNKNPANKSFWRTTADIVTSVSCPDPYTAVFHLAAPFQGFIWDLVNMQPSTGWVMSKAAWTKLGRKGYEATPVGTGPYMLSSLVPNKDVILVRNPNYWGPRPAVGRIDFRVIVDSQTAALAVKTGQVDIASVDPVTAVQYEHTPGVQVIAKKALRLSWLELNTTVKPFNNSLVRQAVRYAIDYKGIISTVLRGYGSPVYGGMVVPGMVGFDASVNPMNVYDPAKAKQLLRQAGVSLPVTGFFDTYNRTVDENTAQLVQANLAAVGLNLKARPLDRGTFVQDRIKPTTPASVLDATESPDPDFLFSLTFIGQNDPPGGLNIARYHGIDTLYKEQHFASTSAQRLVYIRQIQQRLAQDVPGVELWDEQLIWLLNQRVHNFHADVLFTGEPLRLVTLSAK